MIWLALIVGGYLLGSIHFCRILGIVFKHVDICEKSYDRNPGAANAFFYCSKPIGIAGLILDLLKGFLPVYLAIRLVDIENPLFILVMLAPVLGHAFSIFNKFKGGKCISTIFGELFALLLTNVNPYLFFVLAFGDIFFSFVVKILPGNLRAAIFFTILILATIPICVYMSQYTILVGTVSVSLVSLYKHLPIFDPRDEHARKHLEKRAARKAARGR